MNLGNVWSSRGAKFALWIASLGRALQRGAFHPDKPWNGVDVRGTYFDRWSHYAQALQGDGSAARAEGITDLHVFSAGPVVPHTGTAAVKAKLQELSDRGLLLALGLPTGYQVTDQDAMDTMLVEDPQVPGKVFWDTVIAGLDGGASAQPLPAVPANPPQVAAPPPITPVVTPLPPTAPTPPAAGAQKPIDQTAPVSVGTQIAISLGAAVLAALVNTAEGQPIAAAVNNGIIPTVEQLAEQLAASRLAALPNGTGPAWFTHWVGQMQQNPLERALLAVAANLLGNAAKTQ